jgi:hypothetical protein
MRHLTDQQSVRAREWLRSIGEDEARGYTAAELAGALNMLDGVDCYTEAHMAARRQEIFPLRKARPDRVTELERRVTELERTVEKLKQGRIL